MPTSDPDSGYRKPKSWSQVREEASNQMLMPWYAAEWVFSWIAYALRRWALVDVLRLVAHFTVIVAVVSYFAGADDRQRETRYQAWQVINLAQGKPGSGGRRAALQELNEEGASLRGVDVRYAVLDGLNLPNSRLVASTFDSASLTRSDFRHADLGGASFKDATLSFSLFDGSNARGADFRRARLQEASMPDMWLKRADLDSTFGYQLDLSGSTLDNVEAENAMFQNANLDSVEASESNFRGAELIGVGLRRADLHDAIFADSRLKWSDLYRANLSNADLRGVTLEATDLRFANLDAVQNWRDIRSLQLANLYGVKNAPDGFVRWAVDSMDAVEVADFQRWREMVKGHLGDYMFDYTAFSEPDY